MIFRTICVVAILLAGLSTAAIAQSAAAHIPPPMPIDGETFAVPKQLDIRDTDYPLESLLANEEGRVALNLIVGANGRVSSVQLLMSSGSPRLDAAAAQLARTRWEFQPHMKGGQPAEGAARVEVTWKPPLKPAYEYQMDADLIPQSGGMNFEPAIPTTPHALMARDYPSYAIRMSLQGKVRLKFVILESGSVGDVTIVRTSGAAILDQAAANVVKMRWLYKPATMNGKPVPMTTYATFVFFIRNVGYGPRLPTRDCFPEPLLGPSLTMSPEGGQESVEVGQWIHLTADGTVDDLIVNTQGGWMHFAPSAVAEYSRVAKFPPAARERRPPSCWFDGTVTVTAQQK
jgi:protein TonB